METKQFDSIMQEFKKMNQQFKQEFEYIHKKFEQIDQKFEQSDKRFEQIDQTFKQIDARFLEFQRDMALGFMRLERKLDDYKEICIRQHADILDLIETRVQKCKNDREDLHQSQDALYFRIEQLEASQKVV